MKKSQYLIACLLVVASLFSVVQGRSVSASQLSSRSIKMSSSATSTAGVTYSASFTTSGAFQSLIIDFCNESPIIGSSTCTAPSTLNVASAGVTFTTGTIGTVSTTGSTAAQLKVSGTASQAAGSIAFTITNVTNPSTSGTFYARIYTYSNATFGTPTAYSNAGSVGSTVDTGGVALSTASAINISATISEALQFCVSGAAPGPNCGQTGQAVTNPTLTLGSGSPPVLGTSLSTGNVYTQLSTNAGSGAIVAIKNNNSCGGLGFNGSTSSCPIAPMGATATAFAGGDGKFGMYASTSTGQSGAGVAPASPYDQGGTSKYAMDTTANVGVTSTYGQTIISCGSPTSSATNTLTFGADTSPTTPAGIYTATMTLIATATF